MPETTAGLALVYEGTPIRERGELVSLTDMWKASGLDDHRKPAQWLRSDTAREFVDFVAETKGADPHLIITTERGRDGGTWAHWQVALAYAKYLSPDFHAWCNEVVRDHMSQRTRVERAIAALPADVMALEQSKLRLAQGTFLRDTLALIQATHPVSNDVYAAHLAVAAEMATGKVLNLLKPALTEAWLSPSQIAELEGVTANRIGRVISSLGIRDVKKEDLCKGIVNTAREGGRTVTTYLYSERAVEMIRSALRAAS